MLFYKNTQQREVEYHEIEFSTWDCNKANRNGICVELEAGLKVHTVLKPGTPIKIGLLFEHKIQFYSEKGIILNCVAEHVFISPEICGYSFSQMKELVEIAHLRFKAKLLEHSTAAEIPFTLDCIVNDFEVEQVMQQLK
jgi:hypothetical protein